MKIDPNAPAFPVPDTVHANGQVQYGANGLTVRAHFAAMAMQGMCANPAIIGPNPMCGVAYVNGSAQTLAEMALCQADWMITALNAEQCRHDWQQQPGKPSAPLICSKCGQIGF